MARPRPEGDTDTTDRGDLLQVTAGVLLHLVFIGFIAATTVVLFAIASVAFLSSNEPITAFRVDGRVVPPADAALGPTSEREPSPNPDPAEMHPTVPPPSVSSSEMPEVEGAKPSFELPPSRGAVSSVPEPPDRFPTWDHSADPTNSTEARDSEPMPADPPTVGHTSITPVTGRSVSPAVPREVEVLQNRPMKLDQGDAASDEKAPAQKVPTRRVVGQLATRNADLHNRVQKECGSIIFSALRRHCIATFGIHSR